MFLRREVTASTISTKAVYSSRYDGLNPSANFTANTMANTENSFSTKSIVFIIRGFFGRFNE